MERFLEGRGGEAKRPLPETSKKTKKARKYDEKYIEYGFTQTSEGEDARPQCVVCGEVLAKESLKPSKLLRHLQTKHSALQSKPVEFFERKLQELRGQKLLLQKATTVNQKALKASFVISHWIAKTGKPHTLGETFFLPCAKETVSIMCGKSAADQLALIPVSNDTVANRIGRMAKDVEEQVISKIKSSVYFALQLDETTDVSGEAQLLVYARFVEENEIGEDFLFCRPLPGRATGEQIFVLLDTYVRDHDINWSKCVGICSDGARAMTGKHSGLVTKVRAVAPLALWTHCMIHRQALAAKRMPADLKLVMDESVRAVNSIKASATSGRLFKILCQEMGSEHHQLLYHSEVRWLSRGNVLSRLYELRDEVRAFLLEKGSPLAAKFSEEKWLAQLAYLADVFRRLNELNAGLQGKNTSVFTLSDKLEAWIRKLCLWKSRLENENFEAFPALEEFLNNSTVAKAEICVVIQAHLDGMTTQFREYFPENGAVSARDEWIRNPFSAKNAGLSLEAEESLIDLATDTALKQRFTERSLPDFWISLFTEFPSLSSMALKKLLPFGSTFLCESGFSALTFLKNKYRARLNVEDDLRLFLSPTKPRTEHLCASMQAQPSH